MAAGSSNKEDKEDTIKQTISVNQKQGILGYYDPLQNRKNEAYLDTWIL